MPYLSKTYSKHTRCKECGEFVHDTNVANHLARHAYQETLSKHHSEKTKRLQKQLEELIE